MNTQALATDSKNVEESNAQALRALWEELQVPPLEVEIGRTGYLDRVKLEQMAAPVMKGSDAAGRKFIAFRCEVYRRFAEGQQLGGASGDETDTVLVAHERFSDGPKSVWVIAGDCGLALSAAAADYMPDATRLRALCAGEWVGQASRLGGWTAVVCR